MARFRRRVAGVRSSSATEPPATAPADNRSAAWPRATPRLQEELAQELHTVSKVCKGTRSKASSSAGHTSPIVARPCFGSFWRQRGSLYGSRATGAGDASQSGRASSRRRASADLLTPERRLARRASRTAHSRTPRYPRAYPPAYRAPAPGSYRRRYQESSRPASSPVS